MKTRQPRSRGQVLRVVLLLAIACGLVGIFLLLRSRPGTVKAASRERNDKAASTAGPWKKSGERGLHAPAEVPAGNPAEATPQIDAWLEQNWKESDEKLIDGLVEFAQRPEMGLGEKSKALEHALNMLNDPDYGKLDPLLNNKQTSPYLVRQVFDDMHNRGESASLHASLQMLKRMEPEVVEGAREFLAHFLDLDPESDLEAIRMQGETRLLQLQEEKPSDVVELPPDAPLPPMPPETEEMKE